MKFFKKVAAAMLATVCLAGAVMPMASLATAEATYDPCDVNRDGVVNLSDAVLINKYLVGAVTTKKYAQLDANQNLIVDDADAECVLARIINASYTSKFYSRKEKKEYAFPTVSSTISYPEEDETLRTYLRYDYTKRKLIGSYPLELSTADALKQTDTSKYIVIDDEDSRVLANGDECSGIVCLDYKNGTGFIVSDHVIATAAHCIYDYDKKVYNDFTIITYNKDGEKDGGTLTPIEAHFPSKYLTSTEKQIRDGYDYALIVVEEDLSDYMHFSLAPTYNTTASDFSNVPIYVTGFPTMVFSDDLAFPTDAYGKMFTDEGRITGASDKELYYNTDTSGGDSGAPVYTITRTVDGSGSESFVYSAIAIHAHAGNSGDRISKYHLQFYLNNGKVNALLNELE